MWAAAKWRDQTRYFLFCHVNVTVEVPLTSTRAGGKSCSSHTGSVASFNSTQALNRFGCNWFKHLSTHFVPFSKRFSNFPLTEAANSVFRGTLICYKLNLLQAGKINNHNGFHWTGCWTVLWFLLLPAVTPWLTSLSSVEVEAAGPFSLSPL